MVPLTALWLPILLSAVFVFIASFILHMLIKPWHKGDYQKAPTDSALSAAIDIPSGQYMVPWCDWSTMTPEERKAKMGQPMAMMLVRNPPPSFPGTLGVWFLFCLIVSFVVGYLASVTINPGAAYLHVHRVVATAAFLTYSLGGFPDSIWYGRPWRIAFKDVIDGLIYAMLTGGTFGWLWPAA